MSDPSDAREALGRAGRRAVFHLLQAAIEGLKAIEAVIEEMGRLKTRPDPDGNQRTRIEVE